MDTVITLDDIGQFAVPVGYHDAYYGTAIVGNGYLVAKAVLEYKQISVFPIDGGLKVLSFQATEIFCFHCAHNIWFLV